MSTNAARVGDTHSCPKVSKLLVPHTGGPPVATVPVQVFAGGLPALRVGDLVVCSGATDIIMEGKAHLLRLEIGVFPHDDGTRLLAEHPAHPQVLTVFPPGAGISSQQALGFDTRLDRPIRVHDYRAVPWDEVE